MTSSVAVRFLALAVAQSALVMFVVVSLVFFVSRAIGDPVDSIAPPSATKEEVESLKESAGLNDPLTTQYFRFLGDAGTLDFGKSFRTSQPALDEVMRSVPNTVKLATTSALLSFFVGVPLGVIAAVRKNSASDFLIRLLAVVGQATPSFWLGLMLIYFFAVHLRWLPTGGVGDWKHFVLPAATLAAGSLAILIRLTRSAVLEVLHADFVRTARAKGLPERVVITRHTLRNALIPLTTVMGLQVGRMMAGAVIVESIFAWPGLGRLMIQSIRTSDYPVTQAGIIFISGVIVFANLIVDMTYRLVDPRIRTAGGAL